MMKLYEALPNTIEVQGEAFSIKTDFRYWLIFYELMRDGCTIDQLAFLFEDRVPNCDYVDALTEFYLNKNSTPNGLTSTERVLDYIEDGEYLYASFLAEYGIDLIDVEHLHWWKFKALFLGLSEDSIIKRIMSIRGYQPDSRKFEAVQMELKRAWALPLTKQEKELEEELDALFYNT